MQIQFVNGMNGNRHTIPQLRDVRIIAGDTETEVQFRDHGTERYRVLARREAFDGWRIVDEVEDRLYTEMYISG